MCQDGIGVDKDSKTAIEWYQKAADQGNVKAQNALGNMYRQRGGEAKEYALALTWYKKAVDQGEALTIANLGVMYEKGYGLPTSREKAIKLFTMAAKQGVGDAMLWLCKLLPESSSEKDMWRQKAEEQGVDELCEVFW